MVRAPIDLLSQVATGGRAQSLRSCLGSAVSLWSDCAGTRPRCAACSAHRRVISGSAPGGAAASDSGPPQALQQGSPIIGMYTPVTKALWKERMLKRSEGGSRGVPPPMDRAPEAQAVQYSFRDDVEMLENYRNPWNKMRMGRILEDLDSLAGNIAFAHCDDGDAATLPPLLVTAAVERIRLLRPMHLEHNMTMSGQVVHTGTSSLDIRIAVQQEDATAPSLVSLFTFVARDPVNGAAVPVNRLVPQTEQQQTWFDERRAAVAARKAARENGGKGRDAALARKRTAWAQRLSAEAQVMHDMPGLSAGDALLMDQTSLSNTFTCQPQQRNIYGRIFGGFLMRRAYELAFATVHMFAGRRPRFMEVDRVDFRRPVDVGDLVTFRSRILHTRNHFDHPDGACGEVFVQIETVVHRPDRLVSELTNTFNLLFAVDLGPDQSSGALPRALKRVLPATASQAALVERFYPVEYINADSD